MRTSVAVLADRSRHCALKVYGMAKQCDGRPSDLAEAPSDLADD